MGRKIHETFLALLFFLLAGYACVAQQDFIGIAKYKITVEGSNNPATDSMSVIFGNQKVKVILYLPDLKHPGHVSQQGFIDDFSTKKTTTLNNEDYTYTTGALNQHAKYDFINTNKVGTSSNGLCFQYQADSTKFDISQVSGVECLASVDYRNSLVKNYYFLGIQPVIIDNRIVMEFIVTKPGGVKQRIYIYDIKKMDNVDIYFNINGYQQVK